MDPAREAVRERKSDVLNYIDAVRASISDFDSRSSVSYKPEPPTTSTTTSDPQTDTDAQADGGVEGTGVGEGESEEGVSMSTAVMVESPREYTSEESAWFDSKNQELAEYKLELASLRLLGDMFPCYDARTGARTGWVVVTERSRVLCFEFKGRGVQCQTDVFDADLLTLKSELFLDQLLKIAPVEVAALREHIAEGVIAFDVSWRKETLTRRLCVGNGDEFLEVVGCHMNTLKQTRSFQVLRLQQINELSYTPVSLQSAHHQSLLLELWALQSPTKMLRYRETEKWHTELGFSSSDPLSDFDSTGLLGLQCLVYNARKYKGRSIRTGAVGALRIVKLLLDNVVTDATMRQSWADTVWDTQIMTFLSYINHENFFSELFCCLFRLFEYVMVDLELKSNELGAQEVQNNLALFLSQHPTSLYELEDFVSEKTLTSTSELMW